MKGRWSRRLRAASAWRFAAACVPLMCHVAEVSADEGDGSGEPADGSGELDACATVTVPDYLSDYDARGEGETPTCNELADWLVTFYEEQFQTAGRGAAIEALEGTAKRLATQPAGSSLFATSSFSGLEAVPSMLPVARSGLSFGPLVVGTELAEGSGGSGDGGGENEGEGENEPAYAS